MSDPPKLRMKTPEELEEARRRSSAQRDVREAIRAVGEQLPSDRKEYILKFLQEFRTDFLADCNVPLELHFFATKWNRGYGVEPLLDVAGHSTCDAGTALWLYWENDPYFYLRFRDLHDAEDDEERTMLEMSRLIERRITQREFSSYSISFDPLHWIDDKYANAAWAVHRIPDEMSRPIIAPENLT